MQKENEENRGVNQSKETFFVESLGRWMFYDEKFEPITANHIDNSLSNDDLLTSPKMNGHRIRH